MRTVAPLEERVLTKDGLTVLRAIDHLEKIMIEPSQSAIKKRCGDSVDTHRAMLGLETAGFVSIRIGGAGIGYLRAYITEKGRRVVGQEVGYEEEIEAV